MSRGCAPAKTQQTIEPDNAARHAAQALRFLTQAAAVITFQPVGKQQHRGIAGEHAARVNPVEFGQAGLQARAKGESGDVAMLARVLAPTEY